MTAGFVVFSIGHYSFVYQTISMRQVIEGIFDKVEEGRLKPITSHIAAQKSGIVLPSFMHWIIDISVWVVVWSNAWPPLHRVLGG